MLLRHDGVMWEHLGKPLQKINVIAGSAKKPISSGLDKVLWPMAQREDGLNNGQPPERGMTAAAWRKSDGETCVGWAPTTIDVLPLCAHDLCLLFLVKNEDNGGLSVYWDNGTRIILPVITSSKGLGLARKGPENFRAERGRPSVESVAEYVHSRGRVRSRIRPKGVAPCPALFDGTNSEVTRQGRFTFTSTGASAMECTTHTGYFVCLGALGPTS